MIELDYDPDVISYRELLDVFWSSHDASRPAYSRQYRSAIFVRSEGERVAAEASKTEVEARIGRVATSIEPFVRFHRAEDYHQKYRLRAHPQIVAPLITEAGGDRAMVDSTAAARLNGWLGAYATQDQVAEWIPRALVSERSV